jgi:hypothetical protein
VSAAAVPAGPQDYALVVTGSFAAAVALDESATFTTY